MTLLKNKYIISFLSIILTMLSSCKDDMNLFGSGNEDSDGELNVKISMYLPELIPMQTRGVLDNVNDSPDGEYLTNLNFYIFVFEDNGNPHANYLRQLVYANDIVEPPTVEEDNTHTYVDSEGNKISSNWLVNFKVRFDGTAENAILHIVATKDTRFEEQLAYVPDRSEFGIFAGAQGLFTTDAEAYWKRVDLNMAINADSKEAVELQLQHLKMIRNFSRITVNKDITENPYGLVIDGFEIANAVDKGYVAAYNENLGSTGEAGFVNFEDEKGMMRTYRDLHNKVKYIPARHPLSVRQNADDDLAWATEFEQEGSGNMNPKYLFERSLQDDHKTFVILKCHYASAPQKYKYIKLDIGTNDKNIPGSEYPGYGVFESMDVIRNISYDFTIEKVGANNLGHDNVDGALGSPPSNNISVSVETRPVTTINDGIDEMKVNKTTWVIIDNEETGDPIPAYADMIWSYEENFQNNNTKKFVSELVNWNYPGYNFSFENGKDPDGVIASWDGNRISSSKSTPELGEAKDYETNQKGFRLYFNKPDDVTRQKTIRLYKPDGLSRDITFILRKKWEFVNRIPNIRNFNVEVYPGAYSYKDKTMPYESLDEMREKITPGYVSGDYGADLTVMFELPGDLPEAIFPLDFTIGFDRQNVENAFVGNAVATWGPSLWADEGDMPRIQFVKTVTWADYLDHKVVCARFLTTTDVDIDGDDLIADEEGYKVSLNRVRVKNEYFRLGKTRFERSKKDPSANQWYWNFSYPEWANFFARYDDCSGDPTGWPDTSGNTETNPHIVKGLNFGGYIKGQKDDYTNVSGTYLQPTADINGVTRSATNPEFQFDVNQDFATGAKAKMIIQATPNRDRNYLGATYRYEFWYRTVWVKIITEKHPEGYELSQNCDGREGAKAGTLNRYRLEMRTLEYEFDIDPGDTVQQVLIWSVKREGDPTTGLGTYYYRDGATRYYSIEFTIDPNP